MTLQGTAKATPNTQNRAYYNFFITNGHVEVTTTYYFEKSEFINWRLSIPKDATDIKLFINNISSRPVITTNYNEKLLSIYQLTRTLSLSYHSKSMLKGNVFITELQTPKEFAKLLITVKLDPEYVLKGPVKHSTFSTASIYPEPTRMETDGQTISFVWVYNNTIPGKNYPIILWLDRRSNKVLIYSTIASTILFILAVIFFIKKKPKINKVIVKKVDKISRHLKDDEEQILSVLKQKGGKCEQGTLRVVTGMSKAKLSQVLKELEERKIIRKEKEGKRNLIIRL